MVGHTPPMPTADLRTEELRALGPHRDAWDRIVAAQPLPSPFLRSWWIEHAASGELVVLACFDGDDLVGGAAFELDHVGAGPLRVPRVRCVGQGVLSPDHLDLVAVDEHHAAVARAVLAWLRRSGSRVVDLDGLAAQGTLATVLAPFEVSRVAAPFATLTADPQDYLSGRPGKVRSTISRTTKRFARDGVEFVTVAPEGIEQALDTLASLHDRRWSQDSVFLRGWDRFRAAARHGATHGDVRVHLLRDAEGAAVAVELDLVSADRVAFYQAGRRTEHEWRGCGSVLRARIIESSVADGATEYDLLRGDEGYKAEWATGRRELVRCVMGVGPLGAATVRAQALRSRIEARRGRPEAPDAGAAVSPAA